MNVKVRYKNKTEWELNVHIPSDEELHRADLDFDIFEYEINGITFTKWDDELKTTIEQAFFWDNLTND